MNYSTPSMAELADRYIEHRRSLGYRVDEDRYQLRAFVRYAQLEAPSQPLTVKLAVQWAGAAKTKSKTYPAKRLTLLRSFARHAVVFDPRTEIPPINILGPSHERKTPRLYTPQETVALMRAALTVRPMPRAARTNALRNATVIGLLACTGMRIGEALALKNQDVDLVQGLLTVRCSKNLPMRLVPITRDTTRRLDDYQKARDACFGPSGPSEAFFRSSCGGHLARPSFRSAFLLILKKAGLTGAGRPGRMPRLHDFRHTFACQHLLRAYRQRRNIDDAVHELSVYLGHATLEGTYWYLTAIPALLEQGKIRWETERRRLRNGGRP
jgi:integrase